MQLKDKYHVQNSEECEPSPKKTPLHTDYWEGDFVAETDPNARFSTICMRFNGTV